MPLTITSPAFRNGEVIPIRHTRDGENLSPPLEWRDAPPETKSFVLIVEDPDAPSGTFRHWAMYNILAGEAGLPEGASAQGLRGVGEGVNGFRNARYDGPQPPKGHGPHHYHFPARRPRRAAARCAGFSQGRGHLDEGAASHHC